MEKRLQTTINVLAVLCVGFAGGLLYRTPGLPVALAARPLSGCASDKQFLVEFRTEMVWERGSLIGQPILHRGDIQLEADGTPIGMVSTSHHPVQRYLCEGNHSMRISFPEDKLETSGQQMNHTVDFVVSGPAVFQVTEIGTGDHPACVSEPYCAVRIDLERWQDPDSK